MAATVAHHADAAEHAAEGLWQRKASTWSGSPEVQRKIDQRLGWLTVPWLMAESIDRIRRFAEDIRAAGMTDVVLLGMGGSSLAPEVLRSVLGSRPGWPRLHVLDSTDPAAVLGASTDVRRTLYVLASKSGTTIEPNSLAAHFRHLLEQAGEPWAAHFIAITDEGTELARRAEQDRFRDLFVNPSDIGGRYSALSFFGLVPAALMGLDLTALLGWGAAMLAAAAPRGEAPDQNPATALGLLMGAAARSGRDKLTLVVPERLAPFGLWVEQLVAESTGKDGIGILPVVGERLADPATYGGDRFFVCVQLEEPSDSHVDAFARAAERAGAPVARLVLPELEALGAEFVRWEIATAIAGAILRINPFDEPNVQQAKDATGRLLRGYLAQGALPLPTADGRLPNGSALALTEAARRRLENGRPETILQAIDAGDYVAVLAFLNASESLGRAFDALRSAIFERTGSATTLGFGPRYLHSTGQLHKGGPNTGIFVLLTADPEKDVAVPGERYSFGTLELAQALGDFDALESTGRRALHVHLPSRSPEALVTLNETLLAHCPDRRSGARS
jgi:glucose-6-phosphate isomerase